MEVFDADVCAVYELVLFILRGSIPVYSILTDLGDQIDLMMAYKVGDILANRTSVI